MRDFSRFTLLGLALILLFATVATAEDRAAPSATWPAEYFGTDTENQSVLAGYVGGVDTFVGVGSNDALGQDDAMFVSYIHSTTTSTFADVSGTPTAPTYIKSIFPLSGGGFLLSGRMVTTSGSDESYLFRAVSGAGAITTQITGTAGSGVSYYNDGLQVSTGTLIGQYILVGYYDNGTDSDVFFNRRTSAGALGSGIDQTIDSGGDEVGLSVLEVTGSTFLIGGYTGTTGSKDFYLTLVDGNGAVQTNYPFDFAGDATLTADGADDEIRDVLKDSNGDFILIGVTGSAAAPKGYIAKITAATPAGAWEYSTTSTGIEFNAGYVRSNGQIVVTGHSGDDLYLAEFTADGSLDWEVTYDGGRTGEEGFAVKDLGTSGIGVVGAADGATSGRDGMAVLFDEPTTPPSAPSNPSPSNAANVSDETAVTLSWDASVAQGGATPVTYKIYLGENQSSVESQTDDGDYATSMLLDNSGDNTATSFGPVSGLEKGKTYFWLVSATDSEGDSIASNSGTAWSFSTPSANPIRLLVSADLSTGAWVDTSYVGFGGLGTDGYDAGVDVPKPPLSPGDLRMYVENTDLTGYEQILREEYRADTNTGDSTLVFTLKVAITTSGTDLPLSLSFDATTDNADGYGMVLYSVGQDTMQNLAETATFDTTVNDAETHEFALLLGDTTAPSLTFTLPDTAGGNREIFPRSSTTTMVVDFDNSNPIRKVTIQFDSDSTDGDTWTTLTNADPVLLPTDDPRDGIDNPTMSFDWNPRYDDPSLVNTTDVFPYAQLRFISEDWAGNIDTTVAQIAIGPDEFAYPDDAPNATASAGWGTGWHLISLPLQPDPPRDVDSVFSDLSGSVFSIFNGDVPADTVSIMNGYWLLLDDAQATSPATIEGSVDTFDVLTLTGAGWHLVGPSIRSQELTGTLTLDDFEVSADSSSWGDLTTDAGTLIGAGIYSYDNDASGTVNENLSGDFTGTMTPGWGYEILTKSSPVYIRMSHSTTNSDAPIIGGGKSLKGVETNDQDGSWLVPITISMSPLSGGDTYFSETISAVGGKPEATDGVDAFDQPEPPRPPTGKFARIVVDHGAEVDWARYFVVDYRAPFTMETTEASWDFVVKISESSQINIAFDGSYLLENYQIPEGFSLTALVTLPGGEQISYNDLLQTQQISFPYTGGGVVNLKVTASLTGGLGINPATVLPTKYALDGVYPNPFNPSTNVRIALPEAANLKVTVYNVLGKQVAVLTNGRMSAGWHNIQFDASRMASGVYFVHATVPGQLNTIRKIVLVR